MTRHLAFCLLVSLGPVLLTACQNSPENRLQKAFTGNTLQGQDYATYFPDKNTAIMDWQGNVSTRTWWIDEGKFCHQTDDGSVCEAVKQLSADTYEFCGRWGCFPAKLVPGNANNLGKN
jgi:hypothetical protein